MDDAGEIHALGSLRREGSVWSAAGDNVFSLSSRGDGGGGADDDEEALRWAAIEKLPTYDRMRKGIILTTGAAGAGAGVEEVDIQGLGMRERKNLIERLIRTAEEDNERFLLKLRDRMER